MSGLGITTFQGIFVEVYEVCEAIGHDVVSVHFPTSEEHIKTKIIAL